MPNINNALELLDRLNLIEKIDRIHHWRFEAAKVIEKYALLKKAVMLRVDCCDNLNVVANLIPSRDILYAYLGVNSDQELYSKLAEAINNPAKCSEDSFNEYYRESSRNLLTLPSLHYYERDAGRYFTSGIFIARDPDEEIYNASIHRLLVKDSRKGVARLVPRHLRNIVFSNRRRNSPTPVAICFSPHPLVVLGSALTPPYGFFEIEIANRLLGGGVTVCRTPIYNLPVPCECSHVIEGRFGLEDDEEGPFADALLTYDRVRKEPVFYVDKVYESKAGFPFYTILSGRDEHLILMGIGKEADIYNAVSKVVKKVVKVRLTHSSGGWLHAIISIVKSTDGDAKNAILAAMGAHPSIKIVTVVDSDIDPDDLSQVDWAIATRFQAHKDLIIVNNSRLSSLDPSSENGVGSKIGIDATAPLSYRDRFDRARIP